MPNPDVKGRQEILELYLQDKPMADDVDVKSIARGTPGFNGAGWSLIEAAYFVFLHKFSQFNQQAFPSLLILQSDLANLVNIAAIKAAVEGAEKLSATQLEFAKDRIIMGTERKTMFISEESKKVYINHEAITLE